MTEYDGEKFENGLLFRHVANSRTPGKMTALHTHSLFELLYIVSGDVTHVIEGRMYRLKKGDLVLIRPSKYHFLQVESEQIYERFNILFDPQLHGIHSAERIPETMEVVNLGNNPMAADMFRKLDFYYKNADRDTFETAFKLVLNELFINLSVFSDSIHKQEEIISPMLTRALEYINGNLFTLGSVDEVADALFISTSYLFHLFRSSLHQSPKKYINDKRLLAAQKRIMCGERPSVVYKECGFREYAAFYRGYCAFFGHSPSQDKPII